MERVFAMGIQAKMFAASFEWQEQNATEKVLEHFRVSPNLTERRRCMRVRLMVRDCENPRRFVPMNLSAACITDGYTKKLIED